MNAWDDIEHVPHTAKCRLDLARRHLQDRRPEDAAGQLRLVLKTAEHLGAWRRWLIRQGAWRLRVGFASMSRPRRRTRKARRRSRLVKPRCSTLSRKARPTLR